MNEICITVKNKIATGDRTPYVCGNSDYVIRFLFDQEWEEHPTKTARFIKKNGKYVDVVFQGDLCPVPLFLNVEDVKLGGKEFPTEEKSKLYVGVFAGDLKTTTPAVIRTRGGILSGKGLPEEPSAAVYNQLMEQLNEIKQILAVLAGGAEGQILCKMSDEAYDIRWVDTDVGGVRIGSGLRLDEGELSVDAADSLGQEDGLPASVALVRSLVGDIAGLLEEI